MGFRETIARVFGEFPFVKWADYCKGGIVAIQIASMQNLDALDSLKKAFENEPIFHSTNLQVFSHATSASLKCLQCSTVGKDWWIQNQRALQDLFGLHWSLFGLFLSSDDTLVMLVRSSKYVPFDEPEYPLTVNGKRVRLVEGSVSMLSNAHPDSFDLNHAPGYIGASIGWEDRSRSGTLGAVGIAKDGATVGLTAAHCVTFPAKCNFPYGAGTLLHVDPLECMQNVMVPLELGFSVTIDASIVRFPGKVPHSMIPKEGFSQSGEVITRGRLVDSNLYCFAGRSSGFSSNLNILNFANLRYWEKGGRFWSRSEEPIYLNQILFERKDGECPAYEGDSGSFVWVQKNKKLHACGMIVLLVHDGQVPRYAAMTPVEAILQGLQVKINN